jgi:hypothetical protein
MCKGKSMSELSVCVVVVSFFVSACSKVHLNYLAVVIILINYSAFSLRDGLKILSPNPVSCQISVAVFVLFFKWDP